LASPRAVISSYRRVIFPASSPIFRVPVEKRLRFFHIGKHAIEKGNIHVVEPSTGVDLRFQIEGSRQPLLFQAASTTVAIPISFAS
jgi:hypothetical protein